MIRSTGTVFYSVLYLNSRRGFNGLKYMYSVISVIVDSLPGNTKNRESTRSWTARVRLVHSRAGVCVYTTAREVSRKFKKLSDMVYNMYMIYRKVLDMVYDTHMGWLRLVGSFKF